MTTTKVQLWEQLTKRVKQLDEVQNFASVNAINFLDMQKAIRESYSGENIASAESAATAIRSALNTAITSHSGMFDDLLIELALVGYNGHATIVSDALDEIFAGMHALGETVLERAIVLGAIIADGGNDGDGVLHRLTHDKDGYKIEAVYDFTTIIKAIILTDKNTGASSGAERFQIKGDGGILPLDELYRGTMTGESSAQNVVNSGSGLNLQNPSFARNSGENPDTIIDPWVVTSQADIDIETANYFKIDSGFGSAGTGAALKFLDNNKIEQKSLGNFNIDITKPVFFFVRYHRLNSCDGTLTIRLGSQTESILLSTVADATWFAIDIGTGESTKGWYENFKEDDSNDGLRISIELSGRTTGELLSDHIILAQPFRYNSQWWMWISGQLDFLKDDSSSVTDTLSTQGKIQYWLARLYAKYLPHIDAAPTYPDPS